MCSLLCSNYEARHIPLKFLHEMGRTDDNCRMSRDENLLQFIFNLTCSRHPTMIERHVLFNSLKTRELDLCELTNILKDTCDTSHVEQFLQQYQQGLAPPPLASIFGKTNNSMRPTQWECRMPGLIYAWSVDFHASPSVCNIPIYSEIGVVLHPDLK